MNIKELSKLSGIPTKSLLATGRKLGMEGYLVSGTVDLLPFDLIRILDSIGANDIPVYHQLQESLKEARLAALKKPESEEVEDNSDDEMHLEPDFMGIPAYNIARAAFLFSEDTPGCLHDLPSRKSLSLEAANQELSPVNTHSLREKLRMHQERPFSVRAKDFKADAANAKKQGDDQTYFFFMDQAAEMESEAQRVGEYEILADCWDSFPELSDEQGAIVRGRLLNSESWLPLLINDTTTEETATAYLRDLQLRFSAAVELVKAGNRAAGIGLIRLLLTCITRLNEWGATDPKSWDELQRRFVRWPVCSSTHPQFRDPETVMKCLGKGISDSFGPSMKWDPKLASNRIAASLLDFIDETRPKILAIKRKAPAKIEKGPEWVKRIAALNERHKDKDAWVQAARAIFDLAYPEMTYRPYGSDQEVPLPFLQGIVKHNEDRSFKQDVLSAIKGRLKDMIA